MDKIILAKQNGSNIRKEGVLVRIAPDMNKEIDALSEETGIAKTRIIDVLLRKALAVVEVVESDI